MVLNLRPVGPEPATTYWQRRALVLAAALLALLVVVLLLRALLGGDEEPDRLAGAAARPSASPSAVAASASPSPSPTLGPCPPSALEVTVRTEEETYPVGGRPELELSVSTTGTVPCQRDLGQAAVELLVYSGADRIWSSDDCAPGGPAKLTTVVPGTPDVTRLTWSGRRSLPGCAGPEEQAQAGTYRVTARVGELRVEGSPFRFTS
jgi:hypothetical protein